MEERSRPQASETQVREAEEDAAHRGEYESMAVRGAEDDRGHRDPGPKTPPVHPEIQQVASKHQLLRDRSDECDRQQYEESGHAHRRRGMLGVTEGRDERGIPTHQREYEQQAVGTERPR